MSGLTFVAIGRNQSRTGLRPFWISWVLPTTGTNSLFRRSINLRSENRNLLSQRPLFHVQPSGWPFMIQRNIGLLVSWDSTRARMMFVRHGIESHSCSSGVGEMAATFDSNEIPAITNAASATIIANQYSTAGPRLEVAFQPG
jgi:hypothetical protein